MVYPQIAILRREHDDTPMDMRETLFPDKPCCSLWWKRIFQTHHKKWHVVYVLLGREMDLTIKHGDFYMILWDMNEYIWLVVWNIFIFPEILGMSSSQ